MLLLSKFCNICLKSMYCLCHLSFHQLWYTRIEYFGWFSGCSIKSIDGPYTCHLTLHLVISWSNFVEIFFTNSAWNSYTFWIVKIIGSDYFGCVSVLVRRQCLWYLFLFNLQCCVLYRVSLIDFDAHWSYFSYGCFDTSTALHPHLASVEIYQQCHSRSAYTR